jgi:hypothetical protein
MHKSPVVLAGMLVLALAMPGLAKTLTVTGQLVDLYCYSQDKANTGNAHKGKGLGGGIKGYICGRACALEGFPVGVLTADGKVYKVAGELTANSNAKLAPHIAQTVRITGDVSEDGGIMVITAADLTVVKKLDPAPAP